MMNFLSTVKRLFYIGNQNENNICPQFLRLHGQTGICSDIRKTQAAKLETEVLQYHDSTGLVSWAGNNMKRQPTELENRS